MNPRRPDSDETGRVQLLDALYALFRQRGYDGVSLGDISEATGLGRSSLYHHFPGGKDEMAQAVIGHARAGLRANAIAPLQGAGSARQRLRAMLASIDQAFAGGKAPCLLVSMLTGPLASPWAEAAADVLREWIEALADLFRETGLPKKDAQHTAQAIIGQIEGALILSRGLGDPKIFARALQAADETYGAMLKY